MGADDAADEGGIQTVCSVFPQGPAVLHVFFQEHVRQPRVAQEDGQGKVDAAAGTDFFHQQVVALAGAPGLAHQKDFAVFNGQHRLDVQQSPGQGGGFGDAAAPLQILQGVHQGQDAHVLPLLLQGPGQPGGVHAPVQTGQGVLRQDARPDGGGAAVHHIDVVILRRGDAGALIGTGELGSDGQHHGTAAAAPHPPELPVKGGGAGLAGGGQHVAFHQTFIKTVFIHGDAVQILLLAKVNGQRYHRQPAADVLRHVHRGIHDQFNVHRTSCF